MDTHRKKHILLFLPRLHNNIRPLIDGLIENNVYVTVLALRYGQIEDHTKINYNLITRYNFFGKKIKPLSNVKRFEFVSLRETYKFFHTLKPEYLLIRNDTTISFLTILLFGKFYNCKIIFYNQYPFNNPNILQNVYSNTLFKLFKIRTITPVLNANLCEYSTIHNETAEEYRNRLIKQCAVGTSNGRKIWFPFGIQKKPELLKKFNSNSINVTTIGKYEDRKNLNRVAYYLYKISQVNDKKIILTIIGELNSSNSQYLKFLENYCMALQSDKFQIKFLIDVPRDKISDLLSNSQYFILFSECEVASYSQVEAFMNGCKILINCDNGNLDFLPKNERYTIINNMCNFIESIDGNLNSNYIDAEEFTTIYYDLFRSNKIAQRLIQLFETV